MAASGKCLALLPIGVVMAPLHDRMPVILPRELEDRWLDPAETRAAELLPLLRPYAAEAMAVYPVSRAVKDSRADGPALIAPLDPLA